MYCRYCGKEIPDDSKFCSSCGKHTQGKKYSSEAFKKLIHYKNSLFIYCVWCIIHIGLFLFAKPTGKYEEQSGFIGGNFESYNDSYDHSGGFYPFDTSLSNVIQGKRFWCHLIDNIDVYDTSELFFYTIILPVLLLFLVKMWPHIKNMSSRLYVITVAILNKYITVNPVKSNDSDKIIAKKMHNITASSSESTSAPNNREFGQGNISDEYKSNYDSKNIIITKKLEYGGFQTMPIFSRLMGSVIDKILVLFFFMICFETVGSYDRDAILGKFIAMLSWSPSSYPDYNIGYLTKQGYSTDEAILLANSINSDIWAGLKGIDLTMVLSFIAVNIVYYLLCEIIFKASLGKKWLGGRLTDNIIHDNVSVEKCVLRAITGATLMLSAVFVHFVFDLSYYVVVPLFFFAVDSSVFLKGQSLIDIFTRTVYLKR